MYVCMFVKFFYAVRCGFIELLCRYFLANLYTGVQFYLNSRVFNQLNIWCETIKYITFKIKCTLLKITFNINKNLIQYIQQLESKSIRFIYKIIL